MAFRKRNVAVGTTASVLPANSAPTPSSNQPGIRPSPLTSHSVTSTGTPSLDDLLGGHTGLALGSSLLIEESGTTDFAGALLRFYAAEGVCHGHVVHVVGVGEGWVRELPGVAEGRSSGRRAASAAGGAEEKMKIAWRYEKLGQAGERALPDRGATSASTPASQPQQPFCHTFDLSKRLTPPENAPINHIPIRPSPRPFDPILQALTHALKSSPPSTIHRVVIPTLLSPALYPPQASRPENVLQFLHALRALLHQYPTRLTAMLTLPLELHPRTTALVRWLELLASGVLELTPFPHLLNSAPATETTGASGAKEQLQGMLKAHKLPLATERSEGGAGAGNSIGEDLAFTVSRRKFVIEPFALPPVEGDQDAQAEGGGLTGRAVEF
ncbi:hypothetical protein LTR08_005422 [Meristemomyces frigidus]|nr:hypothetical protein LTR08_005422 [Meristemomyces frigidus]